jgi:hypothetical protein
MIQELSDMPDGVVGFETSGRSGRRTTATW